MTHDLEVLICARRFRISSKRAEIERSCGSVSELGSGNDYNFAMLEDLVYDVVLRALA